MPLVYSEAFGDAVARAIGPRSLRAAQELCGVDHTTLARMKAGKIVARETVTRFADGMGLRGRARTELFQLAGYVPDFQPAGAAS